jgi:hypothetical protein
VLFVLLVRQTTAYKKPPAPSPPSLAGCSLDFPFFRISVGSHRNFVQTDILDRGPNNRQATGFRREHVNLIGALAHIAEETLNGIDGFDVNLQSIDPG